MAEEKPIAQASIGVNVMVINDGRILLGKRKKVVGDGMWGLPGGRLDKGEWVEVAAKRELLEETGIIAKKVQFINTMHQIQKGVHWVHFGFVAVDYTGNVVLKEPDVCSEWRWFDIKQLPQPMFPSHNMHIKAWLKKAKVFEEEEIWL